MDSASLVNREMICTTWISLKHYAKWQKPDTKGHNLYDSICMKCPQQESLGLESRLNVAGLGGGVVSFGEWWWMDTVILFGVIKMFYDQIVVIII